MQRMYVDVVLPCEHEQQEPLRAGAWSETASIEGVPPLSAEPHGWGYSVSRSGEIQMSAISAAGRCTRSTDGGGPVSGTPTVARAKSDGCGSSEVTLLLGLLLAARPSE